MNQEMDAVYLLSPLPHIVDCLMADLERRRYRRSFVIWTSCETALVSMQCSVREGRRFSRLDLTSIQCFLRNSVRV